jgi:EF-P lysine aminoacylase GenX
MRTWQKLKQNPELFQRYFVKEYMIKAVRSFFEARNYHELESPIITDALPQERYLDVLEVKLELNDKTQTAYMLPSTETFNKKMLAAGLGEHFVITKVFRGLEDIGPNHSPEFTMLEWYHLDTDYFGIMQDCEELIIHMKKVLDQKFNREESLKFTFQGQEIDLSGPWNRISVPEALEKYVGVKLEDIQTLEQISELAKSKGYQVEASTDWQDVFDLVFLNEIEPHLNTSRPTFVYDYPKVMCPLVKTNPHNPLVCQKVELYIAGREIGNGYTELLDGVEQEERFLAEQAARKSMGRKAIKFDADLIEALKSGMPEVAGIGLGLDRLAMIFADAKSIAEINFFPASEMFADE